MIYPANSAIQRLNNSDLERMKVVGSLSAGSLILIDLLALRRADLFGLHYLPFIQVLTLPSCPIHKR